jgi:branched-chain amino acid transport system ATP-binding protein
VPEGRLVFSSMTVRDNLEIGAYTVKNRAKRDETLEVVFELFPRLRERLTQRAGTMSGGEQQMVAIARGLMSRPQLLILDEPCLGIMPILVMRIMDVIKRLRSQGLSILLVEQKVKQSLQIADRAYLLQTGRIVSGGPAAQMLDSELVRRAYLGL